MFQENAKAFFQFAFAKIFFAAANFIFAVAYLPGQWLMPTNPSQGENFKSFENSCHSLHEHYNSLIFSTSPCNDKQKRHVTDVTSQSSDISDMRKTSTLHGKVLILSLLQHPCNECNVYSNLFFIS